MNIGALLYKATGIMPKKEIIRRSGEIGQRVGKTIAEGGEVTKESFQEIFTGVVGKGSKKIGLITTKEECVKALQDNLKLPTELAERYAEGCYSAVIPGGAEGNKALLNLRITDLTKDILANTAAHESEHALFCTLGYEAALGRTKLVRWINRKLVPQELTNSANAWLLNLQDTLIKIGKFGSDAMYGWTKHNSTLEGLLKQTQCKTREELHAKILKSLYEDLNLVVTDSKKANFQQSFVIDSIRDALKDESRAYKVGGKIQKEFYNATHVATGKHATKSTMNSMLYDEAEKVLKQEARHIKYDFIKNIFGIKTIKKSAKRLQQKGVTRILVPQKTLARIKSNKTVTQSCEN